MRPGAWWTWWSTAKNHETWSLVYALEASETDPLQDQFIINKTNAFMENRNKRFNRKFGAHPNMHAFVEFIKADQQETLDLYDRIHDGTEGARRVAQAPHIPVVPAPMQAFMTRKFNDYKEEKARDARKRGQAAARAAKKTVRDSNGEVSRSRATKKK